VSTPNDAISYVFTWHSMGDACPQCANLNGREWTDQDLYQNTLYDPIWGDVWDLNIDFPLTHGGTGANCRCQLEVRVKFNWEKLKETNQLMKVLNQGQYIPPEEKTFKINVATGEIDTSTVTQLKQEIAAATKEVDELEQKSNRASLTLRQQVHILNEMMMLIELTSGDKNIDGAIQKIQQLMMVLMRLRMLLFAIQEAEAGLFGPLGWLYAGANAIGFGISLSHLGQ
jgi:hypothetical protein